MLSLLPGRRLIRLDSSPRLRHPSRRRQRTNRRQTREETRGERRDGNTRRRAPRRRSQILLHRRRRVPKSQSVSKVYLKITREGLQPMSKTHPVGAAVTVVVVAA